MYVCTYVRTYVCARAHTRAHTRARAHARTHALTHTRAGAHAHASLPSVDIEFLPLPLPLAHYINFILAAIVTGTDTHFELMFVVLFRRSFFNCAAWPDVTSASTRALFLSRLALVLANSNMSGLSSITQLVSLFVNAKALRTSKRAEFAALNCSETQTSRASPMAGRYESRGPRPMKNCGWQTRPPTNRITKSIPLAGASGELSTMMSGTNAGSMSCARVMRSAVISFKAEGVKVVPSQT